MSTRRAAGAWHSEWEALSDALALAGGVAAAVREVTEGLQVYPEKMLENLNATGGLLLGPRESPPPQRRSTSGD